MNVSVWYISQWDIYWRILLAALLGGAIGLERGWNNKAAGFRTHILVCVGSASIMLLSVHGYASVMQEVNVRMDPARLAAQVVNGIGFLGAGAILRKETFVSGLTTAASIWVVAAIGLSVGAGFLYPAVLTSFLVIVCLFVLNKVDAVLKKTYETSQLRFKLRDVPGIVDLIVSGLKEQGAEIKKIKMFSSDEMTDEPHPKTVNLILSLNIQKTDKYTAELEHIARMSDVLSIESNL